MRLWFGWFTLLLSCLLSVGSLLPIARAQSQDPGLRWKRSAALMLSLSVASAGAATGLLLTQESDSFGEGAGLAHAALAVGYAAEGTLRLINIPRARENRRAVAAGNMSWVGPMNVAVNGLFTTVGILMFLLPDDAVTRGAGLTFAVHGAWLTTLASVQWARARRGHRTWLALGPTGLRF